MVEKNNEDVNFNDMTTDELATFINGQAASEPEAAVEENQTSEEGSTQVEDPKTEDDQSSKPEDTTNEAENDKPFYKGKTREDIIRLHEDTNRHVSKQESMIYTLKTEVEALKAKVTEAPAASSKEEDDILSKYSDEDVQVIKKIFRKELEERDNQSKMQTEAQRKTAAATNEQFWKILETTNPQAYKEIEQEVIKSIQENPDSTLYKTGWLQSFYVEKSQARTSGNGHKPAQTLTNVDKKLKAVTVTGGSQTSTKVSKPVNEMTSEEYREYMRTQGLNI